MFTSYRLLLEALLVRSAHWQYYASKAMSRLYAHDAGHTFEQSRMHLPSTRQVIITMEIAACSRMLFNLKFDLQTMNSTDSERL